MRKFPLTMARLALLGLSFLTGGIIIYGLHPSHSFFWIGGLGGIAVGLVAILVERWVARASVQTLLGGIGGMIVFLLLAKAIPMRNPRLDFLLLIVMGYIGLVVGTKKGREVALLLGEKVGGRKEVPKLLDTSSIIDGRIADVCETGFLEGPLVIPQFILRELQQIADSTDPLRRNRGRRGLDILNKIQKQSLVEVRIVDEDFPKMKDVDSKLVELAKKMGGKIITNDYNLNKIAELQGIGVLNINLLSYALKPVVLPGETIHIQIIREGKEPDQGVGYLDDGTMVVVEEGKGLIGKELDVVVTSVLQTTAGRMIFGRPKEVA